MADKVTLTVTKGPIQGQSFVFEQHDLLLFGRARDCHVCLPQDDPTASRYHFLLEVNPPLARVRDVGSLNGTYVNGVKHGGREKGQAPEDVPDDYFPQVDLANGDRIRVGAHQMAVQIELATTVREQVDATEREQPPPDESKTVRDGSATLMEKLLYQLGIKDVDQMPHLAKYEIERELGKGGFGLVYLARERESGQYVAFKIMKPKVAANEDARERFEREIEVARGLDHANIVRLLDNGAIGNAFYFTMPFCDGGTGRDLMRHYGGKVPLDVMRPIMRQVLEGLAYVHRKGYVHRDLKPENILFVHTPQGIQPEIADFGLTKGFIEAGLSGLTATGIYIGTPLYTPKEQYLNFKYIKPRSDVWSIAATFYVMLTGEYPRPRKAGQDPIQVILKGQPIPIRQRDASIPQPIADVIDRALLVNKKKRYQTAAHMLDALEKVW